MEIESPEWWLRRLYQRLTHEHPEMARLDAYYRGDHDTPDVAAELRHDFRQLLRQSKSNFLGLVIDAVEERLSVTGFRLAGEPDDVGDTESWKLWQANQLDAESQESFVKSLVKKRAYVSVWHPDAEEQARARREGRAAYPQINVEDPAQVIVEHHPENRRRRAAALKVWVDDWHGETHATVYLPSGLYKYRKRRSGEDMGIALPPQVAARMGAKWEPREVPGEPWPLPNPSGVVPIVPMVNRDQAWGVGRSELSDLIGIQDRINKTIFDRVLAGELTAFRQKWATGVDIPTDPKTGELVEPWENAITRVWHAESKDARFGSFEATDLGPYIKAIEQDVLHIVAISRTPRHYLIQQGQSPSGDALKSAETGLVAKVRRRQRLFGEAWEEVIRLGRLFGGETAAPVDSEVVWADPEFQTIGQLTDAIIKQFQAGLIPWAVALERLGYTPPQVRRMRGQRTTDGLLRLLEEDEMPEREPQAA